MPRNERASDCLVHGAPDNLRAAFAEAVTALNDWRKGQPEPSVRIGGYGLPITGIFMTLRNCGDALPSDLVPAVCGQSRRAVPRNYAEAARKLIRLIDGT